VSVWTRRLGWAAAIGGALAVVLAMVLHTPPAARWGRGWIVGQVATLWQLDLATSQLRVNLWERRVTLDDVRLSAPGHGDAPFLTARRVSAVLPWSVVRGRVQVSMLEVDDARVLLVREGGTLVNLPPSSGAPPPDVPRRFDLRGLRVRNLDIAYADRTGDVDVDVSGLTVSLDERDIRIFAGASGTLAASSIRIRMTERTTTSRAVQGRMAFDGSAVSLQGLTAPFPEGTVVADGRVNRVLDATEFALTVKGTLDLAAIAAWTPPPVPVAGTGTFEGDLTGPLGGYELVARFAAERLRIGRAEGLPLTGTLSVTPSRALIDPFTIAAPPSAVSPRRGVVEGRFAYVFGGNGPTDLTASWRDLDLDIALAAYAQDPLTFAAWQAGSLTMRRATPSAPLSMRASGASRALTRADRIAVDGTWTAVLERERWRVEHDHRLLDAARAHGVVAWTGADDPRRATLSGPLALEIADVGPVIRAARRSGIDLSESLVTLTGPAHGDLEMAGSLARMVIRGTVASQRLMLPHGAPGTATADIDYDGDTLRANSFEVGTPGASVTGDVTMAMETGRLAGTFRASAVDLPLLAAPFADLPSLSGAIDMAGTIGGTTEVPDVPFTVRSTPIEYGGQRVGALDIGARLAGTNVVIDRLTLDQGSGRVTGRGRVDYESGAYDVSLAGRGLSWARPFPSAPFETVSADVDFTGTGTFADPGGTGTLRVTPVGGSYADLVGPADIRWRLSGRLVHATAFVPSLRTFVQGTVDPRAPYAYRGLAAVSALDVQPLLLAVGALPEALSGTLGLSAAFEGRLDDRSTAQVFVNLQTLDLSVGGLPVRLDRPARIEVRDGDFSVDDLAVTAGASTLTATGRFHDVDTRPLRATLDGQLGDLMALGRAFGAVPPGLAAAGRVAGTWESRGSIDRARATMSVAEATVTRDGLPPLALLRASASYDGTDVSVDTLTAEWQGAAIEGRARLPRAVLSATATSPSPLAGRADVTVRGVTQRALATWLPADTIARTEARVAATIGLDVRSLTLDGLSGNLVLDEASVTAAGVPITQARPGRISIRGRTIGFDDVAFSAGTPVVIGGTVTVGDAETALDVRLTGTPGLRPFSVLSPSMAVDGAATVDLHVTGTAGAPRVEGRIDVDDAEIVMRDPRLIASDITGPLVFEGDRVSIPGLKGFLNGGDFDVNGSARLTGVDVASGEFTFQARGVAVEYPQNVDSEIDALLTFTPGPGDPLLRGDVRVLRGAYRATISLPALVAFNATRTAAPVVPGYLDRLRLDLSVTTEDDLVIDNNYGRFDAGASVRLQGTGVRPAVTGRVELREGGEVFVLGGLYRLNESTISFSNPNAIEPDMNISMVTRSNGVEQTLTLSGTLDRLQTNVTSSDPSASSSVAELLLGGTTSLDRERALRLLSGELLGVTGRAIGLDSLRLERGFAVDDIRQDPGLLAEIDEDPATRLTLSKQLRPDVEVVLSQGIGQGALSGYVTYRPFRGIELRGTSLDNTDRLFSVRHDLSFGGTTLPAQSRRTFGPVASVTFDGIPASDEAPLRSVLRLSPADRFDFIRWRDDVERLRTWYHDRGFLEARVRAVRADMPDGRVALTYRVQRGPSTELRVAGMPVSKRLRAQLQTLWTNAVFDRFLVDEIKGALSFVLIQQNVLNAVVDVTIAATDTAKIISATVRDGQSVARRRIVYRGHSALSPGALDAELAVWGLTDYAWLAPDTIAGALTSRYASEGYHDAKVVAAGPEVVGGEATLTVTIDEGVVTTVASATLSGDDQPLASETSPLVSSLHGRPYRYAEVDAVARQIEDRYRSAGYNNVRVTPRASLSAGSGSAAVTLDVVAGRAQRLAEVVVTGAAHTRPAAVISALGLEAGEAVNLTQWALARKRVFDTNVFRQVDVRPEVLPESHPDGAESVRARVTVAEWPTWRLRYGLQLDDRAEGGDGEDTSLARRRDLGVVANLQNRNVFGRAWTAGVFGRAARSVQSTNAYFTFPTLFGRAIQTNVFATASRRDTEFDDAGNPTFVEQRTSTSVEQRIRRGRAMEIVYGYRLTREILKPVDPENPFYFAPLTGRFTGSAFFDRRDDPFNAQRGWFASVTAERLSEFQSKADTIKLLGTAYRYQRLGRVTMASAVRLGGSFLDPLFFVDPFYVGGADTVRGYPEALIGPKNILGRATGGNATLILNQEVRLPIYRWVRGVAFVDAGSVFESNSAIRLSDLDVGYGAGLRLHTPFSIFRIDLGFPTSAVDVPLASGGFQRTRAPRWYFGLGHVF
jgi:outer membrane protein assembly factor BamA/autotransporter translocation and assembly factor TamB